MRRSNASEIQAAQYELPAFAAGTVKVILVQIEQLVAFHQRQRSSSPMLETALELLRQAQSEKDAWQHMAASITDYQFTQEVVAKEKQGASVKVFL